MLQSNMPGVRISAEHYPPGTSATLLSGLITAAQYSVIAGAFLGQSAVDAVAGTPLSQTLSYIQANKMQSVGISWFMGSSLSSSMLKVRACSQDQSSLSLLRAPAGG